MSDSISVSESRADSASAYFDKAIACFDRINAEDPNKIIYAGREYPRELLYGQRMSERLNRYAPGASEALRLAARSQHIRRWAIARSSYPDDRQGYHRWRRALADFHAETVAGILREIGYGEALIGQVAKLLRKQDLQNNADMQCLEDVICLVFLEYYLDEFAVRHSEEKIIGILQRTWQKMSPKGQACALAELRSLKTLQLLRKALRR